jgi:hypothetical protein
MVEVLKSFTESVMQPELRLLNCATGLLYTRIGRETTCELLPQPSGVADVVNKRMVSNAAAVLG